MTVLDEDDPFAEFAPPPVTNRRPTRDQWGHYNDLPAIPGFGSGPFPNVTTIADTLSDKYHLGKWQERQVALGIGKDPELYEKVRTRVTGKRFNPYSNHGKAELNKFVKWAHETAGSYEGAAKGTLFHEHAEAWEAGVHPDELDLSENERKMLSAYVKLRKTEGIRSTEYIERTVFIEEIGAAGTLDSIDIDTDGTWRIADRKTNKSLAFSHMSMPGQLAAYANASHILDHDTWTWMPMPPVAKDIGLVYWVPAINPGHAELIEADLVTGWKYIKASVRTRQWRTDKSTLRRRVTA